MEHFVLIKKYGFSEVFLSQISQENHLEPARVLSQEKGFYRIITDKGEKLAEVSGKFRFQAVVSSDYPAVGDFVLVNWNGSGSSAIIESVLPRKGAFVRKAVGEPQQEQIVAANIDTVFLCMALNHDFNLRRLERYISIAWDSGAMPVIILTKSDLCDDLENKLSEVSSVAFGIDVLVTTSTEENGYKELLPLISEGKTIAFIGSSGVGKSTLINDTLFPIAQTQLNGATTITPAPYKSVEGLEHFDKVIDIDQSPIGRTPRSNPATYTGVFTPVRELFAGVPESRSRGYTPGRFSFNVKGGRCEACQGDGVLKVEMHFLPDVYVPCDQCKGKRYNRETLEVKYKGKNIHEVLDMTIEEAREFFDVVPALARKLQTLMDVGLSYIRLGQSATTLSGGEAQRVKLAKELSKRGTGQTLYILDEPTTGLHFADIEQLLAVLHQLRDQGNSIVVIEHNLDVIKTADWIVDLGPEGGSGGGEILIAGTPEEVAACERSHTARFLKPILKRGY